MTTTITAKDVNDYVSTSFIGNGDDDYNDDEFDAKTKTYYCNYCNTRLHYQSTDEQTGKHIFLCLKCNIEYIPANQLVKKASKFETPVGQEQEFLASTTEGDEPYSQPSSSSYFGKQQKLPLSFDMLEKKGFKFTHYYEEEANP